MSDKTLTFTAKQLAEALNNVRCLYDLGPELIAEEVFSASAQQPTMTVPEGWKLVPVDPTEEMLSAMTAYDGNYYTHPFDQDDFAKDYAALLAAAPAAPVVQKLPFWEPCNPACDPELNGFRSKRCDCAQAKEALTTPAAPVAQEPVAGVVLRDGRPTLVIEKFVKPTDQRLYTAPPAAEQPECVTCSGHGLVGNRLDDGEECPECHGAGIIFGTECGACAEQPDTVAVPRELLEELVDIADASECFDPAERGRHLLSGGEA